MAQPSELGVRGEERSLLRRARAGKNTEERPHAQVRTHTHKDDRARLEILRQEAKTNAEHHNPLFIFRLGDPWGLRSGA